MLKRIACCLVILISASLCHAADAAQLLRYASAKYKNRKTYQLEWETKITTVTPYSSGWSKQSYIVAASDNKIHFERTAPDWLRVTDGETDWFLERGLRQYSIQPADASKPRGPRVGGTAGGTAQSWANAALQSLVRLNDEADYAEFEKDETIRVGTFSIPCSIVRTVQTTSYREGVDSVRESRYWIDKTSGLVRKSVIVTNGPLNVNDDVDKQSRTVETVYTKADFVAQPDPALFVFNAPANAYLIDDARQTVARTPGVGDAAPALKLTDKEGTVKDLTDLKGKVVLLQFWASWCGACLEEMKTVSQLPHSYFDKGLVIWAVDEDQFPDKGDEYIHSQNYRWTNLHDKGEVAKRQWGLLGYPSVALVDRDGKIVWTNVGYTKGFSASLKAQLENVKLGITQ